MPVFIYGTNEIEYLQKRDPVLGAAMERIGPLEREVLPDLFTALVNSIVAQQISGKALETVWGRLQKLVGEVNATNVHACAEGALQQCGMTFRKAANIKNLAALVMERELDLAALQALSDEDVCRELVKLNGVGQWTAEMLLIFSLERPNVLSYGDLGILRGLRMLYRHRQITPRLFAKYQKRYAPYASVAGLYLWAIADGALPELTDPAPRKK